uniref:Amidase domain-containing protein n=1 Tax=Trypanosoma congolense (strain IL3000) TaxID=1068625 RepID=G0US99_TRYCI|nr:conserved hypothetical protein [Trypanosoma congolense IL3000]
MFRLTTVLTLASVASVCVVWWVFGILAAATHALLCVYVANRLFAAYLMAGPRTSRQIPPTPIAPCQRLSAAQLNRAYKEGKLSCEEVVRTYIEHIKVVNPYINAMVFECFDEAIETAAKADKIWANWRSKRTGKEPSWLLGVPCTIKESICVAGCPNASGLPQRDNNISPVDSPVVKNFRDAGAIILGVTNTSELCLWYESSNHVYGITCNPYDTRRIVGGSSGGEGASAGAAFSVFSLGSDIGGSIRMPAFFNGVFGHKASPHYISISGQHPKPVATSVHFMSTGPISRFVEDIAPLCRVAARGGFLENPEKYPPRPPLRDIPRLGAGTPLRVYILEDYGTFSVRTSASQLAAVRAAACVLEERYGAKVTFVNLHDRRRCSGDEVVRLFKPFSMSFALWAAAVSSDKEEVAFTELLTDGLENFSILREILMWLVGCSRHTLPALVLWVVDALLQKLPKWGPHATMECTLSEFKRELEGILGTDGVIVAPTFPSVAPRHHWPLLTPFNFQYTAIFNVLRMPVTAVPIWQDELREKATVPTAEEARELGADDDYHLPKGVQVAAREGNDELSIAVASALGEALGGYKYPGWAAL